MNSEPLRAHTYPRGEEEWVRLLGVPTEPMAFADADDRRPRRLTPEASESDRLLSHAIEYLTDARQIPCGKITDLWPEQPDVQAIMLMMEARRRVYLACPVLERRSILGLLGTFKGPERRRR